MAMAKQRFTKTISSILIVTSSLLFLAQAGKDFDFPCFNQSNQDNIAFKGNANPSDNIIYLTNSIYNENFNWNLGWAVYKDPIRQWRKRSEQLGSFETHFQFQIQKGPPSPNATYADGLAFFMAPVGSAPPVNGSGMWLGLFNETTNGKNSTQAVAVEFDTLKNEHKDEFYATNPHDPDDNHVGIDINNIISVKTYSLPKNKRVKGNITWNAWVEYDGKEKKLTVFLASDNPKPFKPILSYRIDLSEYLPQKVLVGFSASTGLSPQLHTIISWNFSIQTPWIHYDTKQYIMIAVLCLIAVSVMVFLLFGFVWLMKRRSYRLQNSRTLDRDIKSSVQGRRPREYKYKELRAATNSFREDQKLGVGGFGSVYKGVLKYNGETVAVKRISAGSKQGCKEYLTEVTIIDQLKHRCLVPLLGWCHEKSNELLLVYKFMHNGSLDKYLFRSSRGDQDRPPLEWKVRYRIACDLASALMYLHDEFEQRVVHRDIKSSNIMLDSKFQAKLGDFGLARVIEHGHTSHFTAPSGTQGYLALETAISGISSAETDVFSFGVVALEIACGKPALYGPGQLGNGCFWPLVGWVWDFYSKNCVEEAADDKLNGEFDAKEMNQLIVVGLWCCKPNCKERPKIRQVLQTLKFEAPLPTLPPKMPRLLHFQHELPSPSYRSSTEPGMVWEETNFNVGRFLSE